MAKIDYLEAKLNDLLYELNFCKTKINENTLRLDNASWQNFLMNSDFSLNTKNFSTYSTSNSDELETVDKWFLKTQNSSLNYLGNVSLPKNGVFGHKVELKENLFNKTFTLSFNLQTSSYDDLRVCCQITSDKTQEFSKKILDSGKTSISFELPQATELICYIKNFSDSTAVFKPLWAKLEMGSFASEYVYPLNSNEKLRCFTRQVEISKIIYDKSSPDAQLNWGYTSGIKGGVTVSNKDFSMFKSLKVSVLLSGNVLSKQIFPLVMKNDSSKYLGSWKVGVENGANEFYFDCSVNQAKTTFSLSNVGYQQGTTLNNRNNNASYYVFLIEGVL